MIRYSEGVLREIVAYLSWQRIPYLVHRNRGIVTFSARVKGGGELYKYYARISQNEICLEVAASVEVPRAEKIRLRLLKFCNEVNREDRSGGVLVLDPERGELLCRMTVPFALDSCGAVDRILPVPAGMLQFYDGAIRRLIQGTSSVAREKKELMGYPRSWKLSPLVPEGEEPPREPSAEDYRTMYRQLAREAIEQYLEENQKKT